MKSRVSEKGQVTIPKGLRDRLGIRPGAVLDFAVEDDRLVAAKVREHGRLDQVFGIVDVTGGTDAAIEALRGEAETA
jgi:AbrB family looped-hinge helix DNA binding protein